jgi:hypothetical protein
MPDPIILDFFRGEAPKFSPRLLPAGYAQQAFNCKLFDGKLKPWFGMKTVSGLAKSGTVQSIYPMRDSGGALVWLEWVEDVDVVESLIAGDTTQRICFTGYGSPKTTDFTLATGGTPKPTDWWRLGVPSPITAPSLASGGGGSGTPRDRVYLVTFVHAWASGKTDESAPSTPSAIFSALPGETVNLSSIPRWVVPVSSITRVGAVATVTIPAGYVNWFTDKDRVIIAGAVETEYNGTFEITRISDTQFSYPVSGTPASPATGTITAKTNHNVTKKRIYRTVIGNAGAFYRFVAEIDEVDTTYIDNATDAVLALNGAIPSFDWDMPPIDMKAIVDMGNGILAGISGNEVCFSEPYFSHAWPEKYRRTMPFTGVGTGVVGASLVIGTNGNPVVYSGSHPATMAENKLSKVNHPCLSKRGMISLGFAVFYPSSEGLVSVSEGGTTVATVPYHDRDTWAAIFPSTLRAFQFADRYFGAFTSGQDGDGNDVGGTFLLDRENNIGGLATSNNPIVGGHYDKRTGDLYVLHGNEIKKWDADMAVRLIMDYRSKVIVLPKPANYGAAKIDAEFELSAEEVAELEAAAADVIAANNAIPPGETEGDIHSTLMNEMALNESLLQTAPSTAGLQQLTFTLFAGGKSRFSRNVTNLEKPFRLSPGYKVDTIEIGLAGNVVVHRVVLGETVKSLERV